MSYYPSSPTTLDLSCHTLILPSVSIGNVPQLTCDLLLATFTHHRIGMIYDESITPVVGNDTVATETRPAVGKMSVTVEVYEIPSHKLVVVQQRAPTIKAYEYLYSSRLHTWMSQSHFAHIILLSSQSAHVQKDQQLQMSNPFHYFASGPKDSSWLTTVHSFAQHIGLPQLTPVPVITTRTSTSPSTITSSPDDSKHAPYSWLPGSGITRCLATINTQATERVPLVGLVMSTADSENARDAMMMVELVWSMIHQTVKQQQDHEHIEWRTPLAWEYVFGGTPDETLYL